MDVKYHSYLESSIIILFLATDLHHQIISHTKLYFTTLHYQTSYYGPYLFANFFGTIIMIKIQTALLLLVNPRILHLNNGIVHPSYINYKMFCCWLYSACYTVVQINNCLKRTSTIKVVTMKITHNFCNKWNPSCDYHKIET